jgi:hypothetical protein
MSLTKGVVNFVENGSKKAVRSITKIDTQWIEGVTEDAWHAEKSDRAISGGNACHSQMAPNLIANRSLAAIAVIGVVETQRTESVVPKPSEFLRQEANLIEIE